LSLGEALQLCGRAEEARSVLEEAVRVCERKGFEVGVRRARELMERGPPARSS